MPGRGWRKIDGKWVAPEKVTHVLEIEEDTREWLDEKFLQVVGMVGIRAVGEAAEGFLSNPTGALLLGGGVIAAVAAAAGLEKVDLIVDAFDGLRGIIDAKPGEDQRSAAVNYTEALRALIRGFSPLGPFTPLPGSPPSPVPGGKTR